MERVSKKQDQTAGWRSLYRYLLCALEKGILPCVQPVAYLPAENSHAAWSAEWSSTCFYYLCLHNIITTLYKNIAIDEFISCFSVVPVDKWIILLSFKCQKIFNSNLRLMFMSQLCFFPQVKDQLLLGLFFIIRLHYILTISLVKEEQWVIFINELFLLCYLVSVDNFPYLHISISQTCCNYIISILLELLNDCFVLLQDEQCYHFYLITCILLLRLLFSQLLQLCVLFIGTVLYLSKQHEIVSVASAKAKICIFFFSILK